MEFFERAWIAIVMIALVLIMAQIGLVTTIVVKDATGISAGVASNARNIQALANALNTQAQSIRVLQEVPEEKSKRRR